MIHRISFCILFLGVCLGASTMGGCARENDIFPSVPLDTATASIDLPNPISIATDPTNNQIIVVNSNVNFAYDQGSLATISVDATTTTAPTMTATSLISTPNFGGQVVFDGTSIYLPFREALASGSDDDQIIKYTVGAGSLTSVTTSATDPQPFGATLTGSSLLVVCDDILDIFDTSLTRQTTVDLTTADDADIDSTDSTNVEQVAVDATNNRAYISNRGGKILIVDLTTNSVTHVIDGPLYTRAIATDGTYIYAIDGGTPALWVFNPSLLTAATSPPEEIDDSTILVGIVSLGSNPNGLALDTTNNRAYVANTTDQTISVIDLTLLQEIDRISVNEDDTDFTDGEDPFALAVGIYNGVSFLFVANFSSNTIEMINTQTLTVVASFPD